MKKRLLSVLLILMLLFSMIPGTAAFAQTADGRPAEVSLPAEQQAEGDGASLRAAKTKTVLTFTSDIHNQDDNVAANRLDQWLDFVIGEYGGIDAMGFCGDMGAASANESQFWTYTQKVADVFNGKGIPNIIYTTGNHEFYNGKYDSTSNSVKSLYQVGVKALEKDDFIIYCLGTDNWNNNSDNYTQNQIDKLEEFLADCGNGKPIIILTHFRIHCWTSGSCPRKTTNADKVIDVLNDAAQDKTIVLLWGHNHTVKDAHYDQVFVPNDSVEYAQGQKKTIKFYHCAAGCMSDSEYSGGSGGGSSFVRGKGLVITIDDEKELDFAYYDANGNNVTEDSSGTGPDIPDDPTSSADYYEIPVGTYYIESEDEYFLTTEEGETYVNGSEGSEQYFYYGLKGVKERADATKWTFAAADDTDGYYITPATETKAATYLNATYETNSTGGNTGTLKVDATPDVWTIVSNGNGGLVLKSANASKNASEDKYLSHGNGSGSSSTDANTFTVRSNSNATTIAYFDRNGDEVKPTAAEGSGEDPVVVGSGVFELTNTLVGGKRYVIASANSGSAYALTNPGGTSDGATMSRTAVTVEDGGVIRNVSADAVWTATENGSRFNLTNGGDYLEGKSGNVGIFSSQQYSDRGWTYSGNQLQHLGGQNTYTVYYSSSSFTSTYNDSTDKVYLFVETGSEQPPAPEGAFRLSVAGPATAQVGSDVTYTLNLASDDYETFAAADITLTYDPALLTLKTKPECAEESNGTITLLDYGADKEIGDGIYSFTFTVMADGSATVRVTSAWFIDADGASGDMIEASLATPSVTTVIGPAGYTYEEPTYSWEKTADGNGYTVTAMKECKEEPAQSITETVTAISSDTTPATCTEKGERTWLAAFENPAFENQILTEEIPAKGHTPGEPVRENEIPATCEAGGTYEEVVKCSVCGEELSRTPRTTAALGHAWGEPEIDWADDYSTATATRTCANDPEHVETETVETTSEVTSQPTCAQEGKTTYTAVFTNPVFGTRTTEVVNVPATGHTWGTAQYGWSTDNMTVIAIHVCETCGQSESEIATATAVVTTQPTCEKMGWTTYIAEFTKAGFETQTRKVENIDALGHSWGEPSYEWAADNTSVTATMFCENDRTHVRMETVATTFEITKQATCETAGEVTYTAEFRNEAFETQTKTVAEIDPLGHDWSQPTYTWALDYSKVSAIRVCSHNGAHTEVEIAPTTATVAKEATCETKGETNYTAVFHNKAFETQSVTVADIPALGHAWGEPEWTWAEDYSTATVKYICAHDSDHVYTDEATVTSVKVEPTPEEEGSITYTATAENPKGEAVIDVKVVTLPAAGYTYGEPEYEWIPVRDETGKLTGYRVIAESVCNEDPERIIMEIAQATYAVTTEPGCETVGEGTWTATFRNTVFTTQTLRETIPSTGHIWGEPEWTWTEDNSGATATFTCANDPSHVETVTAAVTSETTAATATEAGRTVYTATAAFEGETYTDTVEVVLPILDTTYTLTYDANGGEGAPEAQTVTNNTLSAEFTVSDGKPTREGFTFKGWARTADAADPMPETAVTLTYPETSVTLYAVWEKNEQIPSFQTQNLVLSGQIGVNFFLDLDGLTEAERNASYMEFTVSGKGGTTTTDPFDPNHRNGTKKYYGFTCYVQSIQMADTITATFHYGEGKTISKTYSVEEYFQVFEQHASEADAKTARLIHSIADYGHYMQLYLASVNHFGIGTDYAELSRHYTESYDYADILSKVESHAIARALGTSKVSKANYRLQLGSETTLDVFLTTTDGSIPANVTVTISEQVTGITTTKAYTPEKQADGRYLVTIPNISAHRLGDVVTITGDADGEFSVRVSPLSFVYDVLKNETKAESLNGLSSLYAYYAAAAAYRG